MYTWGYVKEVCLAKLNLEETEANNQNFVSRFPFYANEAMTQICSSIKPNYKHFALKVINKSEYDMLEAQLLLDNSSEMTEEEVSLLKQEFRKKFIVVGDEVIFPEDFIAFDNDVVQYQEPTLLMGGQIVHEYPFVEASDDEIEYRGYNTVVPKKAGNYLIPYKARWFFFTNNLDNKFKLPVPMDILDSLSSYIASQCVKINDETKSSILRQEYEWFLSRIDDTHFKRQRSLTIGGNW